METSSAETGSSQMISVGSSESARACRPAGLTPRQLVGDTGAAREGGPPAGAAPARGPLSGGVRTSRGPGAARARSGDGHPGVEGAARDLQRSPGPSSSDPPELRGPGSDQLEPLEAHRTRCRPLELEDDSAPSSSLPSRTRRPGRSVSPRRTAATPSTARTRPTCRRRTRSRRVALDEVLHLEEGLADGGGPAARRRWAVEGRSPVRPGRARCRSSGRPAASGHRTPRWVGGTGNRLASHRTASTAARRSTSRSISEHVLTCPSSPAGRAPARLREATGRRGRRSAE